MLNDRTELKLSRNAGLIKHFATAFLVFFSLATSATSVPMQRGPVPVVTIKRDDHLYDIYVTTPPITKNYKPGSLSIYLRRDYPDYMHVPIAIDRLPDGRIHARIAISAEYAPMYSIYIYDHQPPGAQDLLLLSEKLDSF